MKAALALGTRIVRFGFFVAFAAYLIVAGGGGFHAHPLFRSVMIGWACAAVLSYLVEGVLAWQSRAS